MDLRTRLARLDQLSRKTNHTTAGVSEGQDCSEENLESLCVELGLQRINPVHSGLYWRQKVFDIPVTDFSGSNLAGLFSFTPDPTLKATDLLFLDVETTGLSGGTGTLAFLVGLGWWSQGRFNVAQAFLTDLEIEFQMLDWVTGIANNFKAVVTFNGAAFDLPLLRTRALLNRRRKFLDELESLDIIVPARRFWRRSLPDCRQQTLEVLICDRERGAGDIPGREIPSVWFNFLRGEDSERMATVLRHNMRDMQGMALIWDKLLGWTRLADGQLDSIPNYRPLVWSQAWSLARVAQQRGQGQMVDLWLDRTLALVRTLETGDMPTVQGSGGFWRDVIQLAKRRRNSQLIERALKLGLQVDSRAAWLHREGAILYEYRLGDLEKALQHAVQAGEYGRINRLETRLRKRNVTGTTRILD